MSLRPSCRQFTPRQFAAFKLAVAGRVLRIGLRSGRPGSIVHAFEGLITSPFAREPNPNFYAISQFYLRFVETDTERLDLLVWLQARVAGHVVYDHRTLHALLDDSTRSYTEDIVRLETVFRSVRVHRPIERVLQALNEVMPRITLAKGDPAD